MVVFFLAPSPVTLGLAKAQSADDYGIFSGVESASRSLNKTLKIVIGSVLAIGLLVVIYMVATSNPRSRDFVIGWVIAAVLGGIGWSVIDKIAK